MGRGLVVTGTDTGVGKTLVAGGLAAALRRAGLDVGVMKPVESGCRRVDGVLVPGDAIFLRRMAGCRDDLSLVNPYRLEPPLAPALAAESEGVELSIDVVVSAYAELARRHDAVLVEGAGGILSPLAPAWSLPDLARRLCLPMLIVARCALGAISHSLLALYYARREGIDVVGLVMDCTSAQWGQAESLNATAVERWGGAPALGTVPYLRVVSDKAVAAAVRDNVDLTRVLAWLRR